jgi:hypothetical protein
VFCGFEGVYHIPYTYATKAFDRLHYCKLFKLFVKRDLQAQIVRVLASVITNNLVRVYWTGVVSKYFPAETASNRRLFQVPFVSACKLIIC